MGTQTCSHLDATSDASELYHSADFEAFLDRISPRMKELTSILTPIRIDPNTHGCFFTDDALINASNSAEELLCVNIDGVVRPVISRAAVPLSVINSALPRLIGSSGGELT